ncbi:MAG: phenylalanine--tRNA ligase subunit beta, partial [Dehalococcoidales bacterium]
MKVPLKWLKEYIDVTVPPAELANRLTMAGLEATGIQSIGGSWQDVVVGQIVAVDPHPNADRLSLPTVNVGTKQKTVVCGAPNLRIGDKIAFADVGTELIDGHTGQLTRLKTAKIRGVESSGMVCSEKELGISENHEGILVLPPDAPIGTPLVDYLGDTIFDLDITPNRTDCLSVIGIAREVAALTGQKLHLPELSYEESEPPVDQRISIKIADPDLCPRYCATLITGVKITKSPQWLQQRLLACGMRPINNIVDVTNYVMLEYGQPLHAFDYEKITGKKIIVRRATSGEVIVSLDGVERTLSSDILVIADEARAVAIAGVMGGANSEVTENSTSILLEAANFNPASIHYTGRQLSLPSEACMRFERGIRPELTVPAIKRATQLMMQLAGGMAARGIADTYPGRRDSKPILLSSNKVNQILGTELNLDRIVSTLTALGFDCKAAEATSEVWVTTPHWRNGITQAVDLVEEVARIIGYDKIPSTMLSQPLPQQNPEPILALKRKIGESLVGYGFQAVITYSLTSLKALDKLLPKSHSAAQIPIRLANPMTADQEYLRPNLRANLLAVLASNRRHDEEGIRLFELGKIYLPRRKELPNEPETLCGLLSGARLEESWQGDGGLIDFYDAKGVVEGLLAQLGVEVGFEPSNDESLHPTKQTAIIVDGNRLGIIGE